MRRDDHLQDHPCDFLAATGLALAEWALLLPAFEAASDDHTIKVWDLPTGAVIASFTADGAMTACAVVPDGRTIIAGDTLDIIGIGCNQPSAMH